MEFSIDDLDILRQRANVSYRQAREALEHAGGDIVEALVHLEENLEESLERPIEKITDQGKDYYQRVRNIAGNLHQTKVKVRVKDITVAELPVTLGALGTILFPKVAALGMVGLLLMNGSMEVTGSGPDDSNSEQ